jgi:hypothetical protein
LNPISLTLYAALRLSPADSIGVPVFLGGNTMYVPEMDADFNVCAFLDFVNEDQYTMTFDIPARYCDHSFAVGDPSPIIFWIDGVSHIVEGDAELTKLTELFGQRARSHQVLLDLGEMLNDARTGKFKARQEEWLAQELEVAFDDIFLEPPSRTKYWISRYRAALENARKLAEPPHPIDVRLRRASSEWLERFATKAELPMIASILGEASQGIYSIRQITEIMFAYISHRLSSASGSEIARLANDDTIRSLFDHGMYNYYLFEGWPHVPFTYNRPDFIRIMKARLLRGRERKSWRTAHLLSRLLFGDREAPAEIDEMALVYMQAELKAFKPAFDMAEYQYRDDEGLYGGPEMVDLARVIVNKFEQINDLSCVMHGDDRKRGVILGGRFQIWPESIEEYKEFLAKEQSEKANRSG